MCIFHVNVSIVTDAVGCGLPLLLHLDVVKIGRNAIRRVDGNDVYTYDG